VSVVEKKTQKKSLGNSNIAEYSNIKINLIRRVLLSFIMLYFPFFISLKYFALDYIVASYLDLARVAVYGSIQAIPSNSEGHQVLNYKIQAPLSVWRLFRDRHGSSSGEDV